MNIPTKVTLHAEAAVVKMLVSDFALYMKGDDTDAARATAEKISGIVRNRPILARIAGDQGTFLLDVMNGSLGNEAKISVANLMLRLRHESAEVIRGRLEDKKPFPVRRPERAVAVRPIPARVTP
jgi:GGDEF domain-containing protein